ncbi:hypothetical protein CYMTET_36923 [Cymbomonas tetramitiformis]|uniref:Protein kinase domain-containing protein n=1 Tax=Cymbomonas tetramitiformis TaxID=36881 RepID=A0AAE0F6H9_9CHLO|nr:hypothetical protein CYMTET_36923 [Cymbomonas tetramitiformis]
MRYLRERLFEWIGRSLVGCFFKGAPACVANAYLKLEEPRIVQDFVTVKKCGSLCHSRMNYAGKKYVPCGAFQTNHVPPIRRFRLWRSTLRNSVVGQGAFGVLYAFVLAQGHELSEAADDSRKASSPEVVVIKVARCPERSSANRECRDTVKLCDSDASIPIVASQPLFIRDVDEDREPAFAYRTTDNVYVTVCVMPAYDCDMQRFLRDPFNRAVMTDAGERGLLHIARDLLRALQFLRQRNLWYEDLKLANVLVDLGSSAPGCPRCVLGDVGGIYERDESDVPPSTFPSPMSIVENHAVPGCMWALGVFLVEYAIELHQLSHLRGLLYENLKHVPLLHRDERFERACRARTNMKMLSWAIPKSWCTIKKLYDICCPEEAAYAFMNEEDSVAHMLTIVDAKL